MCYALRARSHIYGCATYSAPVSDHDLGRIYSPAEGSPGKPFQFTKTDQCRQSLLPSARRLHLATIPAANDGPLSCSKDNLTAAKRVDKTGNHVGKCKGLHQSLFNSLHADISALLRSWIRKHCSDNLLTHPSEPRIDDFYERRAAQPPSQAQVDKRADIAVFERGGNPDHPQLLNDVTTTCPAKTVTEHLVEPAAALKHSYKAKMDYYTGGWHLPPADILPFAVDLGGAIHEDSFRRFVALAEDDYLINITEEGKKIFDPDFKEAKRYLREAIANTVQRHVAFATDSLAHYALQMPAWPEAVVQQP